MSVTTKVLVQGTVRDTAHRGGVSKVTGELWGNTTLLVIGDANGIVAEVSIRDGSSEKIPAVGEKIQCLCAVGVYRDDDTLDLVRYV
jgi:hypothetical protein